MGSPPPPKPGQNTENPKADPNCCPCSKSPSTAKLRPATDSKETIEAASARTDKSTPSGANLLPPPPARASVNGSRAPTRSSSNADIAKKPMQPPCPPQCENLVSQRPSSHTGASRSSEKAVLHGCHKCSALGKDLQTKTKNDAKLSGKNEKNKEGQEKKEVPRHKCDLTGPPRLRAKKEAKPQECDFCSRDHNTGSPSTLQMALAVLVLGALAAVGLMVKSRG